MTDDYCSLSARSPALKCEQLYVSCTTPKKSGDRYVNSVYPRREHIEQTKSRLHQVRKTATMARGPNSRKGITKVIIGILWISEMCRQRF